MRDALQPALLFVLVVVVLLGLADALGWISVGKPRLLPWLAVAVVCALLFARGFL